MIWIVIYVFITSVLSQEPSEVVEFLDPKYEIKEEQVQEIITPEIQVFKIIFPPIKESLNK